MSLSIQDGKLVKKDATIFTNPTVRGYVSGIMEKDQDGNMTLSEAKKDTTILIIFFPANINGYANPTMSHGPILDFGKISTVADRENYIVSMDLLGLFSLQRISFWVTMNYLPYLKECIILIFTK